MVHTMERISVVSHTSGFSYIEVDSPTQSKSIRLHDQSRFAYIEVDSPTLNTCLKEVLIVNLKLTNRRGEL